MTRLASPKYLFLRRKQQLLTILVMPNAYWGKYGVTVVGGNSRGDRLKQLDYPIGIVVGDDDTVYVADHFNDRIVAWE
jgi:hypothetical protein